MNICPPNPLSGDYPAVSLANALNNTAAPLAAVDRGTSPRL
jgi:hypothetical protein